MKFLVLNPQQLVILFSFGRPHFIDGMSVYTSTLGVPQWSEFGKRRRQKQNPIERAHFTCGQLELLTRSSSPRD